MKQDNDTTFSLMFELGRLIRSRMEKSAPLLPIAQFETLRFVYDKVRPNMRDIAKHLQVSAPSATALVDELNRAQYLHRQPDTKDRRQVRLAMTEKGSRMLLKSIAQRKRVLRSVLSPLSHNDQHELNRILTKITARS